MHLVYPHTFCITIGFNFSWVLQSSREKSKTVVIQNFGDSKVYYGLRENGEWVKTLSYVFSTKFT